ncbi:MAG TPA: hypothetical protein VNM90_05770 [Haliangium sp.]|nr:hypothetical protein [Haliangium sp.]
MNRISLIAFLTVATAAATANAQPSMPLSAAAIDAQNRQDDISTVNGQLVEVGDQNRYRYSHKTWNLSTNPMGLILGFYGGSLSYAVSDHVALRGDLNYYAPVSSDTTGFEIGVGAPLYLRKMYSGLFVEPGVIVRSMSSSEEATVGPQVLLGYHWYWDGGFNTSVAFGAGRTLSSSDSESLDDELFANGYLRFGYAF